VSNKGYIIRERLNESSTTAVYTAFHPALNRTVLLKILHKHLIADKDFVDRFVREACLCTAPI
jgi:serine/threonine protein kinase